jgi:hypothetical protein
MEAIMDVQTSVKPNGDLPHSRIASAEAQCPYCGQPISRKEFREIQARIESEERARIANVEKALKDRFAAEKAKAEAQKQAEIEKAKREAAKVAEQQIKALKANLETTVSQRVAAQREAGEKKLAEAVAAERTRAYGERMKLDAQLADLQRQLQRRTANELGDEGEIDMFEALTAEFPGDNISRVAKGVPGADIVHFIVHNGAVAGTFIYDCKNHKRWQHKFTSKLRQDQRAHDADHAILSTAVFPAGLRQLHIQDGVIVAAPARVAMIAHMLRRHIIQAHVLRLGNHARNEKRDMLYDFIVSDRCTQLFDQLGGATKDMLALDDKEASTHKATWSRRAELIRSVQRLNSDFTGEVERIIGTSEAQPGAIAELE